MNICKKLFALVLAGAMLLSLAACGNSEEPAPSESTESILPEDFVVDTSVEDLCLATAGLPGDFELFTVNGTPVTVRSYLFWLAYNISYLSTYHGLSSDWGSNTILVDYIKEESLSAAANNALVELKAKELGYTLTEEQLAELDDRISLSILMAGGEEAFEDELRMSGLDLDTVYSIESASYYYELLLNNLFGADPTEEEITAYIQENDLLSAKHILLLTVDMTTGEPLEDSQITEQKALAEDILAQLQASDDLAADFDALMHEHSEDTGLAGNPDGYLFTAGEMVSEFEDATRALEFGQISGIVESSYGYHIILRQDPNTETLHLQYRTSLLDAQLAAWLTAADLALTDEYQALDPVLYYAKFSAYQNAFSAELQAAAESEAES